MDGFDREALWIKYTIPAFGGSEVYSSSTSQQNPFQFGGSGNRDTLFGASFDAPASILWFPSGRFLSTIPSGSSCGDYPSHKYDIQSALARVGRPSRLRSSVVLKEGKVVCTPAIGGFCLRDLHSSVAVISWSMGSQLLRRPLGWKY